MGQFEQVPGVVTRLNTGAQHSLVAGALRFDTQFFECDPGKWIEPMQMTGNLRCSADQPVVAADVAKLMKQDDFPQSMVTSAVNLGQHFVDDARETQAKIKRTLDKTAARMSPSFPIWWLEFKTGLRRKPVSFSAGE